MTTTEPGWYPDPGGAEHLFRYWDGQNWSLATSRDPSDPPPAAGGEDDHPIGRKGSRSVLVAGVIAVSVIVLVAVALLIGDARSRVLPPLPSPEVRPSDTAVAPAPGTARPTGGTGSATSPPSDGCTGGDPTLRFPHPPDGRVHGGNLSFPQDEAFAPPTVESRLRFGYDVVQQTRVVDDDPSWIAQLAVGQLHSGDGFGPSPRRAAEQVLDCLVTGELYRPYSTRSNPIRAESLRIDGRPGWLIEAALLVDQPDLGFAGDHVVLVVVRDQTDFSFFFGAVPIANEKLDAELASAVRHLHTD